MLVTAVEKERKALFERGLQQGIEKGIEKGIKQGIYEEKIEIAQNLLIKGFELELIAEITGLSVPTIEKLKSDRPTANGH